MVIIYNIVNYDFFFNRKFEKEKKVIISNCLKMIEILSGIMLKIIVFALKGECSNIKKTSCLSKKEE